MKCRICKKEIIKKEDLLAGPSTAGYPPEISPRVLAGKDIRTYHKKCYNNYHKNHNWYSEETVHDLQGIHVKINLMLLFLLIILSFPLYFIFNLKEQGASIMVPSLVVLFSIALFLVYLRLKLKIKKEYEDRLK